VLRALLRSWDAPAELRPTVGPGGPPGQDALAIRWLGTAAHSLSRGGRVLLLDPFVSRPSLRRLLRPLRSDPAAIARWAPEADVIAVGHSHFDHLLDAPEIARRSGSILIGSASTHRVAAAAGVEAARLRLAPRTRATFVEAGFEVVTVPSLHAKLVLGLAPPFPGEIERVPARRPLYIHEYRVGGAFGLLARAGDVTVYHNGSADLIDGELDGLTADVLLLGLAGRKHAPGYVERLIRTLRPKLVVPTHYDAFFWPLEEGLKLIPGIGVEAFVAEVKRIAPEVAVVAPTPFDELRVSDGGRRFAVVSAR
jgi:L-ascorbate metabolism protein UlaG (beta-lactamase superfamily)